MKIASIISEDIVNSKTGINVSVWCAGCDIRCKGCHNESMWYPDAYPDENIETVINSVSFFMDEGIKKGLSILGGEPFAKWNRHDVSELVSAIREKFPDRKIYCWTGHTLEELKSLNDDDINNILNKIDFLIDGPFIQEFAQTLPLRGSANQRVLEKSKGDF